MLLLPMPSSSLPSLSFIILWIPTFALAFLIGKYSFLSMWSFTLLDCTHMDLLRLDCITYLYALKSRALRNDDRFLSFRNKSTCNRACVLVLVYNAVHSFSHCTIHTVGYFGVYLPGKPFLLGTPGFRDPESTPKPE